MATVTYKTCIENARVSFNPTSKDLAEKIRALEENTKSLNELAARSYDEIRDQLTAMNQQMLTYYTDELPTVLAAKEVAQNTIAEIQQGSSFLKEIPPLSKQAVEHLRRLGCKTIETIEVKEKERQDGIAELEGYTKTLWESILKIDALHKPFLIALENAFALQATGDNTSSFFDAAWGIASYVYTNRAIAARNISKSLVETTEAN